MSSFDRTRCDSLQSSWLEMEKSFLELVDAFLIGYYSMMYYSSLVGIHIGYVV